LITIRQVPASLHTRIGRSISLEWLPGEVTGSWGPWFLQRRRCGQIREPGGVRVAYRLPGRERWSNGWPSADANTSGPGFRSLRWSFAGTHRSGWTSTSPYPGRGCSTPATLPVMQVIQVMEVMKAGRS